MDFSKPNTPSFKSPNIVTPTGKPQNTPMPAGHVPPKGDYNVRRAIQMSELNRLIDEAVKRAVQRFAHPGGSGVFGQMTNIQMAQMNDSTIKGRASGASTGIPQDLTATQVRAILQFAESDGSSRVGFIRSDVGAVATTVQTKLREFVSVKDFNAVGDAVAIDAQEIQAAIDAVDAAGGGTVFMPRGRYNLGTVGITVYGNVRLIGEAQAYVGTTRGTELLYSGTGSAIRGDNILNLELANFSIDHTGSGASQRGIELLGCWLTTIRNVRVKGVTPAEGYGILITTGAAGWGAQHNYIEKCECPDGTIRLAGTGGGDQVTTTVLNTIRGLQYEISNASPLLINATAEGFATSGYTFSDAGVSEMLFCDVEGSGTTGITITGGHSVKDNGTTVWQGFTGTTRVSGVMRDVDNYGKLAFKGAPTAGNLFSQEIQWSDANAGYAKVRVRANDVTGGAQDGHLEFQRNITGTTMNTHELRRNFRLEHTKAIANVATTVLTIPIPTNKGIRVRVHAEGIETGAGTFSCMRDCVAINDAGTVTATAAAEVEVAGGGAAPVVTFTASTTNLLVQFNHASATPTDVNFVIEIDGPILSYTKG